MSSPLSNEENDPETNVVMTTTTQTNSTSVDKPLQATNVDKAISWSVSKRKRTPICFDEFTPATNRRSGPLKKRIKDRCSLDSSYSLPITPSGFYDITPNVASYKNESLSARDATVPPFRMPLKDISTNTTPFNINNNAKTRAVNFERANINKLKLSISPSIERNHSKQRDRQIPPTGNLSVTKTRPTREQPDFLLPKHSQILFKGSKNDGLSCVESNNTSPDGKILNTYMGLMRQQLQFVEISTQEAVFCKAKNVSVHVGQVALRCLHCTGVSIEFRQRGSLIVAMEHNSLYRHFADGKNIHIEELCPFVPSDTKKQLKALRQQRGATLAQDHLFWSTKAKDEGVVQTNHGLRFESSLLMAKNTNPPPIRQQIDDGPFYCDKIKTQAPCAKSQVTNPTPPGFTSKVGNMRIERSSWGKRFLELQQFYEKNGHCK